MLLPAFSKTYDGVTVLDFPGVELQPGKTYAVIGANGSGKSTFSRIAAGILPADQGWLQDGQYKGIHNGIHSERAEAVQKEKNPGQ